MSIRKYLLSGLIILASLVFSIKLFFVQVLNNTYKQTAESNLMRRMREPAYRGCILDRAGRLLVHNVPTYDIFVVPKEVKELDTARFCVLFGVKRAYIRERLKAARRYSWIKPSYVLGPLYVEEFARVQGHLRDFLGFQARVSTIRGYNYPNLGHALGYVAEVSQKALTKDTANYYLMGDHKGVSGVETTYETHLRGSPGLRYMMVNARGKEIGSFAKGKYDTLPIPGANLTLGIDINLQAYAERLLSGLNGSVVALEPSTGEVLVFASAPSYNPQLLSGRHFTRNFKKLTEQEADPLFNRPLQAMYRPGSVFKIAQALVALQNGSLTPDTAYPCNKRLIGCHSHAPSKNLTEAIYQSCNPYFYKVMQHVIQPNGLEENPYHQAHRNLQHWGKAISSLGFGSRLQVDASFVQKGTVPNIQYYDKIYGTLRWKYSNIYSLAIGEGENLVTPLQMANFAAILANGGYYYYPHFVRSVGQATGPLPIYRTRQYTAVDKQYFPLIQEAMQQVVAKGTGRRAKLSDIVICGKTGSVQNKNRPDHSVFIAFAPKEAPQIALSVYVEYAGEGGTIAAAIASLIIEKYLKGDQAKLRTEAYVTAFQPPIN